MPTSDAQQWLPQLFDDVFQGIYRTYNEKIDEMRQSEGLEWGDLRAAQMAVAAGDRPLTPQEPNHPPYTSPDRAKSNLEAAAEHGVLKRVEGGYRATERGQQVVERLQGIVDQAVNDAPVPAEPAARAAEILRKQAQRCEDCDFDTPHLAFSRRFDPGEQAPPLQRLRRAIFDLGAFRDDAHESVFKEKDVPGHEWEAFSHVWGENVWGDPISTPAQAAEKFGAVRGYDEDAYRAAMEQSAERGWLERDGDAFRITEEGRQARAAAEAETDTRYFGPWQLEESEAAQLKSSLEQVRDALQSEAQAEPA